MSSLSRWRGRQGVVATLVILAAVTGIPRVVNNAVYAAIRVVKQRWVGRTIPSALSGGTTAAGPFRPLIVPPTERELHT